MATLVSYLNITDIRSVADVGPEDVVEELEVGPTLLEDAELREGPTDVQPDELQRLLPVLSVLPTTARPPRKLLAAAELLRGAADQDLVELSREVQSVGQRQPPDPASYRRWQSSPPEGPGLLSVGLAGPAGQYVGLPVTGELREILLSPPLVSQPLGSAPALSQLSSLDLG